MIQKATCNIDGPVMVAMTPVEYAGYVVRQGKGLVVILGVILDHD